MSTGTLSNAIYWIVNLIHVTVKMQPSEETDVQVHDEEDGVFDMDSIQEEDKEWGILGKQFPRSEIKFFTQVIILYIVIITCLVNLSLGKSDLTALWISLLSSCIGYLLPSPYIRKSVKKTTDAQ